MTKRETSHLYIFVFTFGFVFISIHHGLETVDLNLFGFAKSDFSLPSETKTLISNAEQSPSFLIQARVCVVPLLQ